MREAVAGVRLVVKTTGELTARGIGHCHWKGNVALNRVLAGEKDYELLIGADDESAVMDVLSHMGFKQGSNPRNPEPPGVRHFFGYDESLRRLVHIHFHAAVVTGSKYLPNHDLPLSHVLLSNASTSNSDDDLVPVPNRGLEAAVFAVRLALRFGSPIDFVRFGTGPGQLADEWCWLREEPDSASARVVGSALGVDEDALANWMTALDDAVSAGRWNRVALLFASRTVRGELKQYRIHPPWRQSTRYAAVATKTAMTKLLGRRDAKRLRPTGSVVALVGPDGAGKSTLADHASQWLGEAFAVDTVHSGKPPSTILTWPLNAVSRRLRKGDSQLRMKYVEGHVANPEQRLPSEAVRLAYGVRSVATAWDRRSLLARARKRADHGEVILVDRYPSDVAGVADSARLDAEDTPTDLKGRLQSLLARFERSLYSAVPPPDLVVRLNVPLEVAVERNRSRDKNDKEDEQYVVSRHRQAGQWHRSDAAHIIELDVARSLGATTAELRQQVWKRL